MILFLPFNQEINFICIILTYNSKWVSWFIITIDSLTSKIKHTGLSSQHSCKQTHMSQFSTQLQANTHVSVLNTVVSKLGYVKYWTLFWKFPDVQKKSLETGGSVAHEQKPVMIT